MASHFYYYNQFTLQIISFQFIKILSKKKKKKKNKKTLRLVYDLNWHHNLVANKELISLNLLFAVVNEKRRQ